VPGARLFDGTGGAARMNADDQILVNSGIAGAASLDATRTGWNPGAGFPLHAAGRDIPNPAEVAGVRK